MRLIARKTLKQFWETHPETEDGDQLDILVTLVEAYEQKHDPIEAPDPIEAVRHALEAQGMDESDLQDIIEARRERVWEIMTRRRRLTMPMIRRLNERLHVPAEVLIRPYEVERPERADT